MLALENVSVSYGKDRILDNFSAAFSAGQVSVLTGASGCGKSTVVKLINGIIPQFTQARVEGRITWRRRTINEEGVMDRSAYVSTVFQNPKTQFYAVSAIDEMAFAMENRNIPAEEIWRRIKKYSALLGTEALLDRDIFKLSGGEKQLLAISSVACLDQDIYVFDEPSASLDSASISRLREAIIKLRDMGKIVIIAEHRLYYLKDIIDQLIVIDAGKPRVFSGEDLNGSLADKLGLRTLEEVRKEDLYGKNYSRRDVFSNCSCADCLHLNCRNFRYAYGRGRTIFDFNPDFKPGINFIIGENGIGKSTFVRCLCGLNRGFKGRAFYGKRPIGRYGRSISLVLQDVNYQLFTESVYHEISISGAAEHAKEELLRKVGLWDKREFHPQALSGGEKQRLAIACSMASDKALVILDEPTSGLCRGNMERTISLIRGMEALGKTIIVVSHDYEFIRACGGNVIEFYHGLCSTAAPISV